MDKRMPLRFIGNRKFRCSPVRHGSDPRSALLTPASWQSALNDSRLGTSIPAVRKRCQARALRCINAGSRARLDELRQPGDGRSNLTDLVLAHFLTSVV